jgi:hypothetical protein
VLAGLSLPGANSGSEEATPSSTSGTHSVERHRQLSTKFRTRIAKGTQPSNAVFFGETKNIQGRKNRSPVRRDGQMSERSTQTFGDPDGYAAAFGDARVNLTIMGAGDFTARLTRLK